MNIDLFLEKMRSYSTNLCIINESGVEYSYSWVVDVVSQNQRIFSDIAPNKVIIDVSLGWRCIPLVLAALSNKITIIPIDPVRAPTQSEYIFNCFPSAIILDSQSIDSNGILHKNIKVMQETNSELDSLNDISFIPFTSGTTGSPKGVMLTHKNIWTNVENVCEYFSISASDRLLSFRPLTNISAWTTEILLFLYQGSSILVKPTHVSPLGCLSLIQKYRLTTLCITPSIAVKYATFSDRYDLSSIRLIVLSGEVLDERRREKIISNFSGVDIWNAYGLTEASPRISCCKTTGLLIKPAECVGAPLKNVQIKIIGNFGNELTEGEEGQLIVSGESVMKGYLGQKDEKLNEGWLLTGDIAKIIDDELYIMGRLDDLIIRSGINVYPNEVEEVLLGVEGVTDAIVFPVINEDGTTKISAWITAQEGIKPWDVFQYLIDTKQDQRIIPDFIEIKTDLTITPSGKKTRPK
ncbi:MAG: class I adenylate-forming enzyme family protein [Bacillota bacterium]